MGRQGACRHLRHSIAASFVFFPPLSAFQSLSVPLPLLLRFASVSVALHLGWRTRNDLSAAKLGTSVSGGGHVVAEVGYAKRTYFSPTIGYFLVSCFVRVNPWVESKKYPCVVQKWVRFAYLKSVPNLRGNP